MTQYIYVLINPSMKGLVKIGKTNRSPEERASELSSATNMPTPFVVAYEEEVPDSHVAEMLIHDELTQQGYRVNDEREFFTIPLKDAIRIVSHVAYELRNSSPDNDAGYLDSDEYGEDSSAEFYLSMGLDALNGSPDVLQDFNAARGHFEKAVLLGSARAHWWLAQLYIVGKGVRQSAETALEILKAGGEKGDPNCYKSMWDIYAGNTTLNVNHEANAETCYGWFLKASNNTMTSPDLSDYLMHSYEKLTGSPFGGADKFSIDKFPGDHFVPVLDMLVERTQEYFGAFQRLRVAMESGVSLRNIESSPKPFDSSLADAVLLREFVTTCVKDGEDIIRKALTGIERADLEYCFSTLGSEKEKISSYVTFLGRQQTELAPVSSEQIKPVDKRGLIRKLFSW